MNYFIQILNRFTFDFEGGIIMLNFLQKPIFNSSKLNEIFPKFLQIYGIKDVTDDRKKYLTDCINKYGYLPYPHFKTLEELTDGEIVFCLTKILEKEDVYENSKLKDFDNPSVLSRRKIKNSNWFKKEGHNIKLISLSALGDGNISEKCGTFIQWIAQIICLPKGNKGFNILADTIYLLPFHPREFGCAYLPTSSDISPKMEDEKLSKFLGLNKKEQLQFFITLAQLMGHPVIYDILPQTGRFSKIVLSNPYVARWNDIKALIEQYTSELKKVCDKIRLLNEYEISAVNSTEEKYIKELNGIKVEYTENEKDVYIEIEKTMEKIKIDINNQMSKKAYQEELSKKAAKLIEKVNGKKIKCEEDIVNQSEIVSSLIKEGLWTICGGAWCSANVPVFDKMHDGADYPIYKHYDIQNKDVTKFANLDCQTPYYFVYLENGKFNEKVIDFYLKYTSNLQKEYNFDGFRVDHIDHVVDNLSEKNKTPVSYRIPRKVLGRVNTNLKKNVPYFGTLAEYMLWDNYLDEYHKDMNFDLLWGNDIVFQSAKTPKQMVLDNKELEEYNVKKSKQNPLSILKTYNNQDGEFEAIDRYPGQLGENGALFKWFKCKFIVGGEYANRPTLYIDGDESFTDKGIEYVIGNEVSMKRNKNFGFYEKFNAINYFAQNSKVLSFGKASMIKNEENGLCAFEINSKFGSFLVIANYKNPSEKTEIKNQDGTSYIDFVYGETIYESKIEFEGRKLKSYFEFSYDENGKCFLEEKGLEKMIENEIVMHELKPAEFKIFGYEN